MKILALETEVPGVTAEQFTPAIKQAEAARVWDLQQADVIREIYAPYADLLTRIVREGVCSGEFEVDSPEATALVLLALFDGITLSMGTDLWQCDWSEIMDAAERLVLHGLGMEKTVGGG